FKGCDFTGSVLSNGQFKSCDFRRGRFEKAKFIGANLNRANMRDCLYINAEDISQAKDINYLVADVDIINELKRINRDNIKYYQIRNTA
ncbi:pentapeptide repeat-containing protein, partial [Pectobacterium versatile]